jgi:hypothetical protein
VHPKLSVPLCGWCNKAIDDRVFYEVVNNKSSRDRELVTDEIATNVSFVEDFSNTFHDGISPLRITSASSTAGHTKSSLGRLPKAAAEDEEGDSICLWCGSDDDRELFLCDSQFCDNSICRLYVD